MRPLAFTLLIVFCFACKKDDPPNPPASAILVFPENNSECTTGTDINPTTSMVEFRWQQALNTDNYELTVTNENTNVSQTVNTRALSYEITLDKGALHTWVVRTSNASVLRNATSPTWRFYNAGFETSYAPFPAEIILPEFGQSVFKDSNNELTLRWSGADIDNDIISYELYFSNENPPTTLVDTVTDGITNSRVTVDSGTVYYWKVITVDREGNTSDSGIYDFRVQ